jgi:hypothetical protein
VNRSKTELSVAVKTKDMAMRMLRDRFRSVIEELTVLLAAEKLPAGDWRVTWQRGTHATRYRVQLQRPGETTFESGDGAWL